MKKNKLKHEVVARVVIAQPPEGDDELKNVSSYLPIISKLKEVKKKHDARTYRIVYNFIIQFLNFVLGLEPKTLKHRLRQFIRRSDIIIKQLLTKK